MARTIPLVLAILFAASRAQAAVVTVSLTGGNGAPAPNAVVELVSDTDGPQPPSRVPAETTIDQRQETFIPMVSVVRQGGHVLFANNDTTKHQVYSFSPIKQFEFEIQEGQHSEPVVFDKPGVASIGCNIHDQMIAYVYVAKSAFAGIADASGTVKFHDVPAGRYHLSLWHPQLIPGRTPPSPALTVAASDISIGAQLPLMAVSSSGMARMHMGRY
jgi:plastocyanin